MIAASATRCRPTCRCDDSAAECCGPRSSEFLAWPCLLCVSAAYSRHLVQKRAAARSAAGPWRGTNPLDPQLDAAEPGRVGVIERGCLLALWVAARYTGALLAFCCWAVIASS